MGCVSHLVLCGLVAVVQARPELGYNYPQPQSSYQLSQKELGYNYPQLQSSFQLSQKELGYNYPQSQSNLRLSQNLYSSAYPQSLSQQNLPQFNQQQLNFQNQLQGPSLNLQQFSNQQQIQYLPPNLQLSQNSFGQQLNPAQPQRFQNFASPSSYNQISQGLPQNVLPQTPTSVVKNIYVHVAPEDPPAPTRVIANSVQRRKNYKIIFIKAPSYESRQQQIIRAAQTPVDEKTLIYVLVNKPQESDIVVPSSVPTEASKPEVYFIKYKAPKQNSPAPVNFGDVGSVSQPGLPIVEDLKKNQGNIINSGESTSSLFSGGLPLKYGPPGYQKRSAEDKKA